MGTSSDMKDIFTKCQDRLQSLPKLLKSLKKIYNSVSLEDFTTEFFHYLKYSLVVLERQPCVERTLDFAVKFVFSIDCIKNKDPQEKEETDLSTEEDDDDGGEDIKNPFLLKLFDNLLQVHSAKDQAVRYRSCVLMNKLLNGLNNNVVIDESLYQKISKSMLDRMRDKSPAVRVHAAHALNRLQDPSDPNCPVIQAYLYHLSHDPHPDVRRAILGAMGASILTLPAVIERTRDVKDAVRRAAYLFLAEKVHVKTLSISQRESLLQEGLKDRSDIVQKAVEAKLLPTWFKLYNNDILHFLRCLDVQESSEVAQLALNTLFKIDSPQQLISKFNLLNDENVIPVENLTFETIFYWRCLCQYIKNAGGTVEVEYLDRILPTLTSFCHYMKSYVLQSTVEWDVEKKLEYDFICHQLLILVQEFDLADQAGRNCLTNLVQDLLLSSEVDASLVKPLVACYIMLKSNKDDILRGLAEIIADVREPITLVEKEVSIEDQRALELKIAKVRVEMNVLREELDQCVTNQTYCRAQEIKDQLDVLEKSKEEFQKKMFPSSQEVRTEKNDPQTLLKCLSIACEMLQQTPLKTLNPTLHSLMESLLLPGIQNEDPAVRNKAVLSLGLCCLLNCDVAMQHLILFFQISQVDQEAIQVTALKVIFDLLLYYGPDAFQNNDQTSSDSSLNENISEAMSDQNFIPSSQGSNHTLSNVMSILATQLDSEFQDVRAVTAEGIGKMLIMERVYSPRLFSRLLLMWFNPTTESDTYLRHFLGVFFTAFVGSCRTSKDCIEESFLPTLRTLFDAPSSSPLAMIDPWNVARFLIHLSSTCRSSGNHEIQESTAHDHLAVQVCNEILQNPDSFNVRVLSKILGSLTVTPSSSIKDLACLSSKLIQEVKDKTCLKLLEKFNVKVQQAAAKVKGKENCNSNLDQELPSSIDSTLPAPQGSTTDSQDVFINDCSSQTSSETNSTKNDGRKLYRKELCLGIIPPTPPSNYTCMQNIPMTAPIKRTRRTALSLPSRRKSTK